MTKVQTPQLAATKLIKTAEFCLRLGSEGMNGVSALNVATDVLKAVPPLVRVTEAAAKFYAALVDSEGWDVTPASSEWLALQEALGEAGAFGE